MAEGLLSGLGESQIQTDPTTTSPFKSWDEFSTAVTNQFAEKGRQELSGEAPKIEQPKPTGALQKIFTTAGRKEFLYGEKPLFEQEATSLPSKIGKGILNTLGELFVKPMVAAPIEVGSMLSQMPAAVNVVKQEQARDLFNKAMANSYDEFIRRIPTMSPDQRNQLREFLVSQQQTDVPEVMRLESLDKSVQQALGTVGMAGLGALQWQSGGALFGTGKYLHALSQVPMKRLPSAILQNELLPVASSGKLFTGAGVAVGKLAAANAGEWALWSSAIQAMANEKDPKKFAKNVAVDTALGATLGTVADVGISKLLRGIGKGIRGVFSGRQAAKVVEDLAGEAGLPSRKFGAVLEDQTDQKLRPSREVKIKEVITSGDVSYTRPGGLPKPSDFRVARPGDIVATGTPGSGTRLYGQITAVSNRLDVTAGEILAKDVQPRLTALTKYAERLQQQIEGLTRLSKRVLSPEEAASAGMDVKNSIFRKATIRSLRERLASLTSEIGDLQAGTARLSKGVSIPSDTAAIERLRTVTLLTKEGEIEIPIQELRDKWRVVARTIIEPEGIEKLRTTDPIAAVVKTRQALEATEGQLAGGDRFVTLVDDLGRPTRVPYTDIVERGTGITDTRIRQEMEGQGFSLFRTPKAGEKPFEPRKVTGLGSSFWSPAGLLRASGIPIEFLERGKRQLVREASQKSWEFRQLMTAAKREVGKSQEPALQKLLFRAANEPGFDLSKLTPTQLKVIARWKRESQELLSRTNEILGGLGLEPVKGREAYIANLITDIARAFLNISERGMVPEDVAQLFGKEVSNYLRRLPKTVVNKLLEQRSGVLPIQENFERALGVALNKHLEFIHMQPRVATMEMALKHFDALYGGSHPVNSEELRDYLMRISGRGHSPSRSLRDLDNKVMNAITAERLWFGKNVEGLGPKNPLHKLLTREITLPINGKNVTARVPKAGLIKLMERVGTGPAVRTARALSYTANLALSPAYMILNMTQFWALSVPRLRGTMRERWADAARGWYGAWKEFVVKGPKQAMEDWRRTGLLQGAEDFLESEVGLRRTEGPMKYVRKVTDLTSQVSEFVNRVGTVLATEHNIIRDASRKTGALSHWVEVDRAMKGELARESKTAMARLKAIAHDIGFKYSEETQFRYDDIHRAAIQYNPLGALIDQYNSFFRNWGEQVLAMGRRSLGNTDARAAIKSVFDKGDVKPFLAYLSRPDVKNGEKGELFRFMIDVTALTGAASLLGGSLSSEFYFGGGPRILDASKDIVQGLITGDNDKFRTGIESYLRPPAIDAVFEGTKDAGDLIRSAFGEEPLSSGVGKFLRSRALPFKKGEIAALALRAALTGKTMVVSDPRTGKPLYTIDPEDAVAVIAFGSRSKSEKERLKELDELHSLRLKQTKENERASRTAEDILSRIEKMDSSARGRYLDQLVVDGTIDNDMVARLKDVMRERYIYQSGAIERSLSTLQPEYRAEFLARLYRTLSPEERKTQMQRLIVQKLITPEVIVGMEKILKEKTTWEKFSSWLIGMESDTLK